VPSRAAADPDVSPGRRNGERTDAVESSTLFEKLSAGTAIREALTSPDSPDPGLGIRRVDEAFFL